MKYIVFGICVLVGAIVAASIFFIRKRTVLFEKNTPGNNGGALTAEHVQNLSKPDENTDGPIIKVEMLPIEEMPDKGKLVEITDSKVLARVDNLVPEFAQASITGANAVQAAKAGSEVLYRAIIPAGAKLTASQTMEGTVRGFYREGNRIQGHANFVAVQTQKGTAVAANTAAAAMSVASMVVGQYYMTQINAELGKINDGISKISEFQNNEFKSSVVSLVLQVKAIADYQIEILENNEIRSSKITQLDRLEENCTKLLGQVNSTLEDFAKKDNLTYTEYEKETEEAQKWYIYQKALVEVLCKIAELKYTLYMGAVSREQCETFFQTYKNHVENTHILLVDWHKKHIERLGIDIEKNRIKRTGLDWAAHFLPGLKNDDCNYRAIDEKTAEMITDQSSGQSFEYIHDTSSLYAENVQLISIEGKIYYLPENKVDKP